MPKKSNLPDSGPYRVLNGLTYPRNPQEPRAQWVWKRAEPGEIVDDLVPKSINWLLDVGWIERVTPEPQHEEGA